MSTRATVANAGGASLFTIPARPGALALLADCAHRWRRIETDPPSLAQQGSVQTAARCMEGADSESGIAS